MASHSEQVARASDRNRRLGRDVLSGVVASDSSGSDDGEEDDEEDEGEGAMVLECDMPQAPSEGEGMDGDGSPDAMRDQVHSVYVTLPEGFQELPINLVFDDMVQSRIFETCRRSISLEHFRRLWPRGRRDLLASMRLGIEETGRGAVAHGLQQGQAESLVAALTQFVTAEMGVDRDAAARLQEGRRSSGQHDGHGGDAPTRVHSVYFVLPVEMQGMLHIILPEILPRIVEVCRRYREFGLSWPGGQGEMERTLRQGLEESGRGPLLHGLQAAQAEALRDHLAEFVAVEVVVDREAAARLQDRERRSWPPPRPPPLSLLSRFLPGSRVRISDGRSDVVKLQKGFGGWTDEAEVCLGQEGVVAAYVPAEGPGAWGVRVFCDSTGDAEAAGTGAGMMHTWNPENLKSLSSEVSSPSRDASPKAGEVVLANDEDIIAGDNVLFHSEGCWCAGHVTEVEGEDTFTVKAVDERLEENLQRRQIQMVLTIEPLVQSIVEGSVVRICSDLDRAKRAQRTRWTDGMEALLGQVGLVVENRNQRNLVLSSPASSNPTAWSISCVQLESSEGLRCLDLHEHPLWWCTALEQPRSCSGCSKTELKEAHCCVRSDFALCEECAEPYLKFSTLQSLGELRTRRHHLFPMSRVTLPRGVQESHWSCDGVNAPGGCRSASSQAPVTAAACCSSSMMLLCIECLKDPDLGQSTPATRKADVEGLPASASRILATLRQHPSEVFALCEVGLLPAMAKCMKDSPCVRELALELCAWLSSPPPVRAQVGPCLSELGGEWVEAAVIGEDCDNLDGSWTDETDPGKWVRAIKDGAMHPPEGGAERDGDHVIEVSGCGMSEFDGIYMPDGVKNGKTKYRKIGGALQTCNYSSGAWYLCHNHGGSWYQSSSDDDIPPSGGWVVGNRGRGPVPTLTCVTREGSTGNQEAALSQVAFRTMPSVGTWLRTPSRRQAAAAGLTCMEEVLALDGVWHRDGSGDTVVIRTGVVTWMAGNTSTISGSDGVYAMELQGQRHNAVWDSTVNRLLWDDGELWTKQTEAPAGSLHHGTLQEGQTVRYRDYAHCTVKSLLSDGRVVLYVHGAGEEVETEISDVVDAALSTSADSSSARLGEQPVKIERLGKDTFSAELGGAARCAQLMPDGRMVWADGGNTWVRMDDCPRCSQGHVLKRSRHTAQWTCKSCEERRSERVRLHCSICDYNLCDSCLAIRSWEKATGKPEEARFAEGAKAEVRVSTPGSHAGSWLLCTIVSAGETEGTYRVQLDESAPGAEQGEQQTVSAGRLRCPGLQPVQGPTDALWCYASPNDVAIGIRTMPEIEGPREGQMQHGQAFRVSEHREGADGILFLQLADGRGWVFDKKPGVGTMCVLLRARGSGDDSADGSLPAGLSSSCSLTFADDEPSTGSAEDRARLSQARQLPVSKVRPAFGTLGSPNCGGDFARAELIRELRRGTSCAARHVKGLLEGQANLLRVDGGEDPLGVAVLSGCSADVLEALLMAHAPLVELPADSPEPASASASEASSMAVNTIEAILAMKEPRLTMLVAERSQRCARLAAESMERAKREAEGSSAPTPTTHDSSQDPFAVLPCPYESVATAARKLSETARPRGCVEDLLCSVGKELIVPLLEVDDGDALEPASWLRGLLKSLKMAGYKPKAAEVDYLVAAIATRFTHKLDDSFWHALLSFLRLLLDLFISGTGESTLALRALRVTFQRHGVIASIQRLADANSLGRLQRSGVPSAADPMKSSLATALLHQLDAGNEAAGQPKRTEDSETTAAFQALLDAGSKVAAVAATLPSRDGLEKLINMLRDGACTPFELGMYGVPRKILPMFAGSCEQWPWASTPPLDAENIDTLVDKLLALLGMCEAYPVAALSVRAKGLDCLLQPHELVLEGAGGKKRLKVAPLLRLSDLEQFVLHTTPVEDVEYLEWCRKICGCRIGERPLSLGSSGLHDGDVRLWRTALVVSFSMEARLPVHTLRYEDDGSETRLLLHLRNVVLLGSVASSRKVESEQPEGRPKESRIGAHLIVPGSKVKARFEDGSWCRATVERDNGDGTLAVKWENGTQKDTIKSLDDLQPLPGKAVCQRVQVKRDAKTVAGVAVWEHASGAQDVVDQEGHFLGAVARAHIVPEARHAQDCPGRPMPFEIRNLSMPDHDGSSNVLSLERAFSAVDRNYRPRDFQYKNPARKIGGPEGEPLQRPGPVELTAAQLCLEKELLAGTRAPKLRVRFFSTSGGSSPSSVGRSTVSSPGAAGQRTSPGGESTPSDARPPWRRTSGGDAEDPGVSSPTDNQTSPRGPTAGVTAARDRQLPATKTVLQAFMQAASGGGQYHVDLSEGLVLGYEIYSAESDWDQTGEPQQKAVVDVAVDPLSTSSEGDEVATDVLALLKQLRERLKSASVDLPSTRWENGPLNRKLADQLAQPLLAAAVATPPWVMALPLSFPFLFERSVREQLLRCSGFGTSHAVLWLQQQSIEERYGERLRRVEGQLEGRMDLTEQIVSDPRVFIGPARSDFITLPSREGLLVNAQHIVSLTYASKAMLEVKFADEGGFGDGVTQSFYSAIASELTLLEMEGPKPFCGPFGLWTEHGRESTAELQGKLHLHSRRGLFPRPCARGSAASEDACDHFRFLGRLMAKALRDGFVVPLSLCPHFFAAVLGEELPLSALPQPGDGWAGEFIGAAAKFAAELRRTHVNLEPGERLLSYEAEANKAGWARDYLGSVSSQSTADWSFNQYVKECSIAFLETGFDGHELCPGGSELALTAGNLEEFVERAASWWLRDGIRPQVEAFRRGVEDVCSSGAIWAFEASELSALFCGGHVEWSRAELLQQLRPRSGVEESDIEMLVEALNRMSSARRGQFLEFVTACPRLPPGGLAAAKITVAPATPAGSLPRARTCTKELRLPKYESVEHLEEKLFCAIDNAEGLYDDNRMG